jgi:hypothetical protein
VTSWSADSADAGHVAEPDMLTLVAAAAAAEVEAERDAALRAAQQYAAAHASAERARAAAERAAQAALASAEARLEECAVLRARLAAAGVPSSPREPASATDTYVKDEKDGTTLGVARTQGLRAGQLGEMKEGEAHQKGHGECTGESAVFPESEKVESNEHENSERGGGGRLASSDAETQTIDVEKGPAEEDGRPSEQGLDHAEGSAWSSSDATTRDRTAWENERGVTCRGGAQHASSAVTLQREEEEGAEEPLAGHEVDAEDTEHEGRRDIRVEVPEWGERRGRGLASGTWDPRVSLANGWGMVSPVFRHRGTRRQSTGGWSDEGPGDRSGGGDVERATGPIWRRNSTVNLT